MKHLLAAMVFMAAMEVWAADDSKAEYKPVPGDYPMSKWAKEVSPENALPEYPRPMMVRKDWMNLNGKELGTHRGGYDAFSFDITGALNEKGENELVVAVWDPTASDHYPRGKQTNRPGGIFYIPCTGIWQTAWLEPVSETSISGLKMIPDIDRGKLELTVAVRGGDPAAKVRAEVFDGEKKVAEATGTPGKPIKLPIPNAKLWWPDDPFLYGLKVALDGSKDAVESYFGMRKSSLGKDDKGITRMMLNNKFIVQNGVLDQGYWPGGNLTAPTDAALRYDIEAIKQLGFNMSRKHIKVEPQRWYYWCDKLGLLVWQDMPSISPGSKEHHRDQFMAELEQMIDERFNHPSIVSWIPFNEGWGLGGFDLKDVTAKVIAMDGTRLANHESGAGGMPHQGANRFDAGVGHIVDFHCYHSLNAPKPEPNRAAVIGEYGYAKYLGACKKYAPFVHDPGVSGFVWTQITDVERERNGLMTYDRGKFNEDPEKVAAENEKWYKDFMKH